MDRKQYENYIKDTLHPILEKMLVDCLQTQPKDPVNTQPINPSIDQHNQLLPSSIWLARSLASLDRLTTDRLFIYFAMMERRVLFDCFWLIV